MWNSMKRSCKQKIARIRVLVFDVDGVLTDGTLFVDEEGRELKVFHTRDGLGLVLAKRAGLKVVFFSGKASPVVLQRARMLGVDRVMQGIRNKGEAFERLIRSMEVSPDEVCYMGDDIIDLPCMRKAGLAVAVSDADESVRQISHWVSSKPGGRGAVRELVETVLKIQGKWDSAVERYYSDTNSESDNKGSLS